MKPEFSCMQRIIQKTYIRTCTKQNWKNSTRPYIYVHITLEIHCQYKEMCIAVACTPVYYMYVPGCFHTLHVYVFIYVYTYADTHIQYIHAKIAIELL